MMNRLRSLRSLALLLCVAVFMSGCATFSGKQSAGQKLDPWESWNRKVFSFNEGLDEHVLKPVATVYADVVPHPVRTGVSNFFNNVGDAWSAVNLVLQGRFSLALQQGFRFAVNSTLGFAGVLDIATEAGIDRNSQDLGQTFGRWGFGTGAYIVWPLFGPSSVRDSLALPWDRLASPALAFDDGRDKVGIYLLQTVNTRSNYLQAGEMLDGIALDKYTFIRDAYLQRRGSFSTDDDDYEVLTPGSAASASQSAPAASAAASAPASAAAASSPSVAASAPDQ
ncbi:VacJ family lipoprotein [Paucibacter sp. R3-3]|uniref:VacJ family lipoprotein n=2 Tax=Roseateles agri TaxID=3098619 RepID=A0ABU5DDH1_9BURK|nr:VacJ family lipoprotein [Paucibacter sp. R3-3]